jgi:hypothetical protein
MMVPVIEPAACWAYAGNEVANVRQVAPATNSNVRLSVAADMSLLYLTNIDGLPGFKKCFIWQTTVDKGLVRPLFCSNVAEAIKSVTIV